MVNPILLSLPAEPIPHHFLFSHFPFTPSPLLLSLFTLHSLPLSSQAQPSSPPGVEAHKLTSRSRNERRWPTRSTPTAQPGSSAEERLSRRRTSGRRIRRHCWHWTAWESLRRTRWGFGPWCSGFVCVLRFCPNGSGFFFFFFYVDLYIFLDLWVWFLRGFNVDCVGIFCAKIDFEWVSQLGLSWFGEEHEEWSFGLEVFRFDIFLGWRFNDFSGLVFSCGFGFDDFFMF